MSILKRYSSIFSTLVLFLDLVHLIHNYNLIKKAYLRQNLEQTPTASVNISSFLTVPSLQVLMESSWMRTLQ